MARSPLAIWVTGPTGRILASSGKGLPAFALSPQQVEDVSFVELFSAFPAVRESYAKAARGEGSSRIVDVGDQRLRFRFEPVEADAPSARNVLVFASEVASTAAPGDPGILSMQLAEAERIVHMGSWQRDLATSRAWWSEGLRSIFGIAPSEEAPTIEGFLAFVHPEDRDRVEGSLHDALEGGSVEGVEYRIIRGDGQTRVLRAWGSVIHDPKGRPLKVAGIVQDITERHQDEDAKIRLAQIVETADDAIISKGLDGIIRTWNPAAERLFGYAAAEAIGQPISILLPPDRLEEEAQAMEQIRRGEPVVRHETVRRRKDGSLVDVAVTISPIRNAKGTIIGASKIARDNADRKAAEAERQLRLAREEELRAMKEEDAFKTQFLNNAAHELKTPMTPLKIQSHLLKTRLSEGMNAQQLRSIEILDRSLARLQHLVEELLESARLQSNRLTLEIQPTDLGGLGRETLDSFEAMAKELRIRLEGTWAPDLRVEADPQRLAQVINNLVGNALKFTPNGGAVTVQTRREGAKAVLEVRDTGAGLTRQQIAELFQPFSRVHRAPAAVGGGSGLGLFISKGIVEQHGGKIWCTSPGPGKGASFFVQMALTDRPLPSQAAQGDAQTPPTPDVPPDRRDTTATRLRELI